VGGGRLTVPKFCVLRFLLPAATIIASTMIVGCGREERRATPAASAPPAAPAVAVPDSPLTSILADSLGEWRRHGAPRTWSSGSLDQYIGADAERWRLYELADMVAGTYDRADGSIAFVELYRFRAPSDAFGAYSTRRGFDARLVSVGDEAFVTARSLLAWKGTVVLRVVGGSRDTQAIEALARVVTEPIPGGGSKPSELLFLAGQSIVPGTEIWTREDAFGYSFLRGSAIAKILAGDAVIEVLRHPGRNDREAMAAFEEFRSSVTRSAKTIDPVLRVGNEAFFAQDSHLANTLGFRTGRDLVVLRGQAPPETLIRIAEDLAARLHTAPPAQPAQPANLP
jgi:hypothetical protein